MRRTALIDPTGRYRYVLTRRWASGGGIACFVMLNPSTADAARDDPTIRRCIDFARRWGHASLHVVNLYAFRTEHPAALFRANEPVGPDNDRHLWRVTRRADTVICAWGVHGLREDRGAEVAEALQARGIQAQVLGWTQGGAPRHPLFLRTTVRPKPWIPMRAAQ